MVELVFDLLLFSLTTNMIFLGDEIFPEPAVSFQLNYAQDSCHRNLRVGPHKAETKGMMVVNTPLIRPYLAAGIGGYP